MGIGSVNKMNLVVSQPPTAPSLRADVKVEDNVGENTRWSAVELSSAGRNAYKQFQIVMKSACMV